MDKKSWKYVILGLLIGLFVLPLLSYFGVPTYVDFLTAVFGENNLWGIVFSLGILILYIIWKRR